MAGVAAMRLHSSKWVLATGLVAGVFAVYHWRPEFQEWIRRHQFQVEGIEAALPTEVYFLETNRWLEFKIPKGAPLARLISNASISSAQPAPPDMQWPYAIEYQLVGVQGRTNLSGVYNFRGEHLAFTDKASGRPVEVNAYMDRRFTPLGARN